MSSFLGKSAASGPAHHSPFQFIEQSVSQLTETCKIAQLKQRREALLSALCSRIVDCHPIVHGILTPEMAVAAKVAILDELGALPIDDLSQTELNLRAEAIRNRVFGPYLQKQQEQMECQQDRQHQQTLQRQEASQTQSRRVTRKAVLIELGVARALRHAKIHGIKGRALVVLEYQVRSRLELLLVGDETDSQVEETIEASIEVPILEWAARLEGLEQAKRGRMLDDCLTLALLVAQAAWPWMKNPAANTSPADDGGTASQDVRPGDSPDIAAPRQPRRRRRSSSSSATTSPQSSSAEEVDQSTSQPNRAATG
jgi:hypothetical protein